MDTKLSKNRFKAYDKESKEWVEDTIAVREDGHLMADCAGKEWVDVAAPEEYEIVQYIGMTDTKGQELLEGSIISALHGDPRECFVVVYQAPSFVIKRKAHHKTWMTFPFPPGDNQPYELLGHILTDAHLLD